MIQENKWSQDGNEEEESQVDKIKSNMIASLNGTEKNSNTRMINNVLNVTCLDLRKVVIGENGTEEEKAKAKNAAMERTVNAEQELTDPNNEAEKKAQIQKQEMEAMVIPEGFEFSRIQFTSMYYPEDDMPLMPQYRTYNSRLQSFKIVLYRGSTKDQDDVRLLVATGYYFYGTWPKRRSVACFCCGARAFWSHLTVDVIHHQSCIYFQLPENEKYILDGKVKLKGKQVLNPEVAPWPIQPYDFDTPICEGCNRNEIEVRYHPCQYRVCITCAKSSPKSICCKTQYSALIRLYSFTPHDNAPLDEEPCIYYVQNLRDRKKQKKN